MPWKWRKHVLFSGTIKIRTGTHVGGTREDIEIGGMDNPVIRDPVTRRPYIPGSSLKGRLRSILEYKHGKVQPNGDPCSCRQEGCPVCRLFGPHKAQKHDLGPSRLIVRDALLSEESAARLRSLSEQGLEYVEVKTETAIDRSTGIAGRGSLRTQERVPPGAEFQLELSLRVFEGDNEQQLIAWVEEALDTLPVETVGGSGTRGYGWVEVSYEHRDA